MGYCVGPSCHSPGGGAGCRLCRILQRPGGASSRVRVWGREEIISPLQNIASSRVWVWGTKVDFWRILQKCLLARAGVGALPNFLRNPGHTPDFRRNPAVTGRGPPGLPVRCRPGAGCGKRIFRAKGRCGSGAGGYGDMGREEIRRLCLNMWASPAVSPGGQPPSLVRILTKRFNSLNNRVRILT